MVAPFRLIAAIVVSAMFSACSSAQPIGGSNNGTSSQSASTGAQQVARSFPKGLIVTDQDKMGRIPLRGVYQGIEDPDPSCCWIAPKAEVTVARSGNERNVTVQFYIANIDYFDKHPQTIVLTVGKHAYRFDGLKSGIRKVSFELDPSVKSGPFTMTIAGNAFVPSKVVANNGDSRVLSAILSQVEVH